jgi:hypothetical protein
MGISISKRLDEASILKDYNGVLPDGIFYGNTFQVSHAPCFVYRTMLDQDVLQYLQIPFLKDLDQLKEIGFEQHVDSKNVIGHTYYEGYFHVHRDSGIKSFQSMHPRHGHDYEKPAAPEEYRNFFAALWNVNREWIENLGILLKNKCGLLGEQLNFLMIKEGRLFADLAVQIHFGDEVNGENLAWHCDAANSLLHMALSIKSKRALHIKSYVDLDKQENIVHWNEESSVYVSSPFAFIHAVEYPETSFENRIIAVQARLLLSRKEYCDIKFDADWNPVLHVISWFLNKYPLKMPQMQDIISIQ